MLIGSSLIILVIGLLMYAFAVNPKLSEVGRIMFFAGMLAFLLNGVGQLATYVR